MVKQDVRQGVVTLKVMYFPFYSQFGLCESLLQSLGTQQLPSCKISEQDFSFNKY